MTKKNYRRIFRLGGDSRRDQDRELELHLEMKVRELEEAGHAPGEARRLALEAFGDVAAVTRRLHRVNRIHRIRRRIFAPLEDVARDLRLGSRSLWRDPGFSLVAVVTMAVAVAAGGAVFTVVDNVLLRPLQYREPDRLVTVWSTTPVSHINTSVSYPDFEEWRRNSIALESMAFLRGVDFTIEGDESPEYHVAALATPGLMEVLGARAQLGSLDLSDRNPGEPLVVLKNSLWRSRFGGDPGIVGSSITSAGLSYTVAAVLERGVGYPAWADLYVQLTPELIQREGLDSREYRLDNRVVGRLAAGASIAAARAELGVVTERLALEYPRTNEGWGAEVVSLTEQTVGDVRQSLSVLLAAAGVLLLIACGNLANLALARAVSREQEFSVRAALGAGGLRIARQVMTESVVLAAAGTACGLMLGHLALTYFINRGIPGLPRIDEISLGLRVLLAAGFMGLVVSCLFGLAPAIFASRSRLGSGRRAATSGRGMGLFRGSLVVGQVALAMILMIGAALLFASFQRLRTQDPGFDAAGLVTLRVNPPEEYTGRSADRYGLYRQLVAETVAQPGVAAATMVSHMPLSGTGFVSPVGIPGVEDAGSVWVRSADRDFFEILGIPILRGRALTTVDHEGYLPNFVVSAAFVRGYFPDQDPLGRTITIWRQAASDPDYGAPITGQIVGVAGDVMRVITEQSDEPVVYLPLSLQTWTSGYLVAKAAVGGSGIGDAVRAAVRAVDPRIPTGGLASVSSFVGSFTVRERFLASFGMAFSAIAVSLALVGVYGVLAYAARQRSREIGVRIALGAVPSQVARWFLGRGLSLVAMGLVVGTAGALAATRLLQSVLFETSPTDPVAFVAVAICLLILGGMAGWIPARRASRIDPVVVMREE